MSKKYFTLRDMIKKEKLTLSAQVGDLDLVFDRILPKDKKGNIVHPLIIGIDGSVTAGKTLISSRLNWYLQQRNIHSVLIHGDWFMASRSIRTKEIEKALKKNYSFATYDQISCDFKRIAQLQSHINKFFRVLPNTSKCYTIQIPQIYNRNTGKRDQKINLSIDKDAIVIFEGTGILNSRMHSMFDISMRIDINTYKETVRRLLQRETQKDHHQLSKEFITKRYKSIDFPYDGYLRSRDSTYFNFLLDTSDPTSMKIYARSFSP